MVITTDEIRRMYADLIEEKISREDVSNWAIDLTHAEDDRKLIYFPEDAESVIWSAIMFFTGVDLKSDPSTYLHSEEDILFNSSLLSGY